MINIEVAELLESWLAKRLDHNQRVWFDERLKLLKTANSNKELHITLGFIPRKLPRNDLELSKANLDQANALKPGWDPSDWSIDVAARIAVLCRVADRDPIAFGALFQTLCQTADLSESMTLYRGTAVFPESDRMDKQIAEGLRTNMRAVFEAIAHRNPYPQVNFDQHRWNHMILKALFIDSTLAPIQGLDERANEELAKILCDYAHERWAAGRVVTPELWRCVGPFATGTMIDDLQKVVESTTDNECYAGLFALQASSDPRAATILAQQADKLEQLNQSAITWESITE